jgi:hypothetical protein
LQKYFLATDSSAPSTVSRSIAAPFDVVQKNGAEKPMLSFLNKRNVVSLQRCIYQKSKALSWSLQE